MQNTIFNNFNSKLVTNHTDYMNSFRQNVRTCLNEKNMSLKDLSDLAEINYDTLKSLIYGNTKDCKISTVINLAKALDLSIDELVGCGTISPTTSKAIQATRKLPEKYIYYLCWSINYHLEQLKERDISDKFVDVMYPKMMGDGNVMVSNIFKPVDITSVPDRIKQKTFLGFKMICDKYMPQYTPYDILLVANDRKPYENEPCIIIKNKFLWLVYIKDNQYYSYKDKTLRGEMNSECEVIGYVCGTIVDNEQ